MVMPLGLPSLSATLRISLTAAPSEAPGPVLKPTVAAGNCATWRTASGAVCSLMLATVASGVVPPVDCSCTLASPAGVASTGRDSRITRYWLVSVKMVEMIRWPNAE